MSVICDKFDNLGVEDASRMYRLGIMGGTFDPIHIGHLACAEQAREAFELDAVIFIPAGNPVFKKDKQVTEASKRLEMCRRACASNPLFDVSSLEIDRTGDTYTVDTLRELREHYPENVELYFITGADAMFSMVKWYKSDEIASMAKLIGVTRPGYDVTDRQLHHFEKASDFEIAYLEVTALAISSTDLRERVRQGKSIRYLTMQSVRDYIDTHKLYRGIDA